MADKGKWKYSEGFLVGAVLFIAGVLIQALAGPVRWTAVAMPLNLLVLASWAVLLVVLFLLRKKHGWIRWMMRLDSAVPAVGWCIALTLVLGITAWNLLSFWGFVLEYAWLATIIVLTCINHTVHFSVREIPFLLNHLGIVAALVAGSLGAADIVKCDITLNNGEKTDSPIGIELRSFHMDTYPPELALDGEGKNNGTLALGEASEAVIGDWRIEALQHIPDAAPIPPSEGDGYRAWFNSGACTAVLVQATNGADSVSGWVTCGSHIFSPAELPLPDGSVLSMKPLQSKGFSSDISVTTPEGLAADDIIEVNRPMKIGHWRIYQKGYDVWKGRWSDSSTLQVIRDPWQWLLDLGIYMLLAGAVLNVLMAAGKKKEVRR